MHDYIADLHIHSKYSRATSRDCDLPHLAFWARRKGIGLLGTGDFTHPAWREELREQLEPAGDGVYALREAFRLDDPLMGDAPWPLFVITGEISSIYKKKDRVRKVHNLLVLPGLEQADELSGRLEAIGNIHADGRPILGLDCRDLLEIMLEASPQAMLIPAHIWTPHFSLFGAFSGFDRIEDCFEDLTTEIHALETGLSSDPPMNWRVSALDRFTLVSHSDAHSPAKLGREADLIEGAPGYGALKRAIETGAGFAGTLEFFPEEGKYHYDGHRNCHLRLSPAETIAAGGMCPVCGKKITIGVQHRVETLADRPEGFVPPNAKRFESLVPLAEVIAASTGASAAGRRTREQFEALLRALGPEFYILRQAPLDQIARYAGPCVAEGIRRLRIGQVDRLPGYDGEYGTISLLDAAEIERLNGQVSIFGVEKRSARPKKSKVKNICAEKEDSVPAEPPQAEELNPEQRVAVTTHAPQVAVIAGPGTGKTKTLVARIAYLIEERGVRPSEITAVTFTNQTAREIRERLEKQLGKRAMRGMTIGTFHAICLRLMGQVRLVSTAQARALARQVLDGASCNIAPAALVQAVSRMKNGMEDAAGEVEPELIQAYCAALEQQGLWDFDDLLLHACTLDLSGKKMFHYLLIDEFQDVNSLQSALVDVWRRQAQSLFVIGDPDQSIYGFRGADGQCFARLKEACPALQEIRLVQNYRSTPQILSCARPVIAHNEGGARALEAAAAPGLDVRLVTAPNDFSEAVFIAKEISRMAGGMDMLDAHRQNGVRTVLRSFSEIAVLCRTHRQLDLIESCLRHDDIPCVVSGREDFLEADDVRGALGFFAFLLDPADEAALAECLAQCWKVPADLVERAAAFVRSWDGSLDALRQALGAFGELQAWLDLTEECRPHVQRERPRQLFERWLNQRKPTPTIERLLGMAVFYRTMPELLEAVLLGEEDGLRRASGKQYASGAVRLTTLHGAKGLEFPAVFVAGLKENMLPLVSSRRPTDLAEERRLFYVGLTRAREELILTAAMPVSDFVGEIPDDCLLHEQAAPPAPPADQLSLF